jgi:hypothetical protein
MTGKLIGDRVPNPPELRNTISEWLAGESGLPATLRC